MKELEELWDTIYRIIEDGMTDEWKKELSYIDEIMH
jgi:hypothetical protein